MDGDGSGEVDLEEFAEWSAAAPFGIPSMHARECNKLTLRFTNLPVEYRKLSPI